MTEYKDAEFWNYVITDGNGFIAGIRKEAPEDVKKQFSEFMTEQIEASKEGFKV